MHYIRIPQTLTEPDKITLSKKLSIEVLKIKLINNKINTGIIYLIGLLIKLSTEIRNYQSRGSF